MGGGGGGKKLQQLVSRLLHMHQHQQQPSPRRGHFAVYVGQSRARFVVPTAYLKQPSFVALLERAEEDYFGLDHHSHPAGLALPSCSEQDFATLVRTLG